MIIKNDDVLACLTTFGFSCEESTPEGFLRYQKRIGNLIVTVANGQFENKIRISMLQDAYGHIRTSYQDLMQYTELIGEMINTGLIDGSKNEINNEVESFEETREEEEDMDNPLLGLPKKPEGFMVL